MNWTSYPARTGRLRPNETRVIGDPSAPGEPGANTSAPTRLQPRPLYREPVQGTPMRRPMPEPGFRSYREPSSEPIQRQAPAPRPAYREDRPEPRAFRQPERVQPQRVQPERPQREVFRPRQESAPAPMRQERSSPAPASDAGEAPGQGARRRNRQGGDGG